MEVGMSDIDLSEPNIINVMNNGATLQRHGDLVEMNIPDTGSVRVPTPIFDSLLRQGHIEGCGGGFYKLTGS
jgi:hypothetical protein